MPPEPPLACTWGTLMLLVRQVPARQPREPPAAWAADAVGAADVVGAADAAAEAPVTEPLEGVLSAVPAEPDDPPHAASSVADAAAATAQPAAGRSTAEIR